MNALFLAIEGPTGAGKTTLAARLATVLDATAMFDPFEANPFLPQLLTARGTVSTELALRVELTFVALRVAQLRHIGSILATGRSVIADWALLKQPIFAATTLIGLSASANVLRGRVRRRGRGMDSAITAADLASLTAAFDHAYAQRPRPLICVDTTSFDVFDDRHLSELAAQVRRLPIPLESR